MPTNEEFLIPNLNGILKQSKKAIPTWDINPKMTRLIYQFISPQDEQLAKKLEIEKTDKIFIFAGHYGDWAYALSQICSFVAYSDVSINMVRYVVNKYPCLREHACVADGVLLPFSKEKEKCIDWLFSFEPYPLIHKQFPLVLLQGLSRCRRGVIILISQTILDFNSRRENVMRAMSGIAKSYGATYTVSKRSISTTYSGIQKSYIAKLETNDDARACSTLDLEIILHLQTKGVQTKLFRGVLGVITADKIAEMGKMLGKDEGEILKSLRRITALSKFIELHCVKKCTFSEG